MLFVKFLFAFILSGLSFFINSMENSVFFELTSPKGKTHFLFGTIHVDDNRVSNFHPTVYESIKSSNIFLMETDEIQNYEILQNENLIYKKYFDENQIDKIKDLAYFHTMPFERIMLMKPWLLAVIFNSPRPITPFNQDNLLKTKAADNLLIIQGLESVNEHFSTLDSFSIEDQIKMLDLVLARSENEKQIDYDLLVDAYLSNSPPLILKTDQKVTKNIVSDSMWNHIENKLLIERNKLFFERILEVEKDNKLFIAVGASHLSGENGLLNQFKSAGYKMKPLNPFVK